MIEKKLYECMDRYRNRELAVESEEIDEFFNSSDRPLTNPVLGAAVSAAQSISGALQNLQINNPQSTSKTNGSTTSGKPKASKFGGGSGGGIPQPVKQRAPSAPPSAPSKPSKFGGGSGGGAPSAPSVSPSSKFASKFDRWMKKGKGGGSQPASPSKFGGGSGGGTPQPVKPGVIKATPSGSGKPGAQAKRMASPTKKATGSARPINRFAKKVSGSRIKVQK